jgi:hypothetical protein
MRRRQAALLVLDAIVNLALGILLAFFPTSFAEVVGVPLALPPFYASVLGAVLIGIGLALLVERFRPWSGFRGLGLGGAICINVCGAGALVIWLISGALEMPLSGYAFLWAVGLVVLGLSVLELVAYLQGSAR